RRARQGIITRAQAGHIVICMSTIDPWRPGAASACRARVAMLLISEPGLLARQNAGRADMRGAGSGHVGAPSVLPGEQPRFGDEEHRNPCSASARSTWPPRVDRAHANDDVAGLGAGDDALPCSP